MAKKKDKIKAMLVACRECESQYIIRSLQCKLRIGLAEKGVLAALARALILTPISPDKETQSLPKKEKQDPSERIANANSILRQCYSQLPSYDLLIESILKYGLDDLATHCSLTPGKFLSFFLSAIQLRNNPI
jgi:DNA ligase 1